MAKPVAAMMVMVAVLLVGTCATGAFGDGTGKVDLVNTCNNDTVVLIGDEVTGIVVAAGQTAGVDLSVITGLIGPVYIRKGGELFVITVDELNQILGLTGVIYKIEIVCNGKCGVDILTITVYAQVYANGVAVGLPVTATVCADVVVL